MRQYNTCCLLTCDYSRHTWRPTSPFPSNVSAACTYRTSICLGLFALLCWDALFVPVVPATAPAMATEPPPRVLPATDAAQPAMSATTPSPCEQSTGEDPAKALDVTDLNRVAVEQKVAWCTGDNKEIRRSDPLVAAAATKCKVGKLHHRGSHEGLTEVSRRFPGMEVYHPFPSPFQSEPADLMTTTFAGRRRHLLNVVYARVENGEAGMLIRRNWKRHYGKACTGERKKLHQASFNGRQGTNAGF